MCKITNFQQQFRSSKDRRLDTKAPLWKLRIIVQMVLETLGLANSKFQRYDVLREKSMWCCYKGKHQTLEECPKGTRCRKIHRVESVYTSTDVFWQEHFEKVSTYDSPAFQKFMKPWNQAKKAGISPEMCASDFAFLAGHRGYMQFTDRKLGFVKKANGYVAQEMVPCDPTFVFVLPSEEGEFTFSTIEDVIHHIRTRLPEDTVLSRFQGVPYTPDGWKKLQRCMALDVSYQGDTAEYFAELEYERNRFCAIPRKVQRETYEGLALLQELERQYLIKQLLSPTRGKRTAWHIYMDARK